MEGDAVALLLVDKPTIAGHGPLCSLTLPLCLRHSKNLPRAMPIDAMKRSAASSVLSDYTRTKSMTVSRVSAGTTTTITTEASPC
jgi:hypothetical protein